MVLNVVIYGTVRGAERCSLLYVVLNVLGHGMDRGADCFLCRYKGTSRDSNRLLKRFITLEK